MPTDPIKLQQAQLMITPAPTPESPQNVSLGINQDAVNRKYIYPDQVTSYYGVDLKAYTKYGVPIYPWVPMDEWRAKNQSRQQQWGRAAVNTGNELVIGTLKGVSDIPKMARAYFTKGGFAELADASAREDVITSFYEGVQDRNQIYLEKDEHGFVPWKATWWAQGLPSVATTVAMLAPTMASAKLIGYATKLLGSVAKSEVVINALQGMGFAEDALFAGKTGTALAATIGGALYGNAYETYLGMAQQLPVLRQQLVDSGKYSSTEIDQILTDEAEKLYRGNLPNAALDMFGIYQLLKPMGGISKLISTNTAKRIGATALAEGIPEGVQEGVNYFMEQRAQANVDKFTGLREESDNYDLDEFFNSGEALTNMAFGAIGGMLFMGAGNAFNQFAENASDKDAKFFSGVGRATVTGLTNSEFKRAEAQKTAIAKLKTETDKLLALRSHAELAGDTVLYKALNDRLTTIGAIVHMGFGTFGEYQKHLEQVGTVLNTLYSTEEGKEVKDEAVLSELTELKQRHAKVVEDTNTAARFYSKGNSFYGLELEPLINYTLKSVDLVNATKQLNTLLSTKAKLFAEDEFGVLRSKRQASVDELIKSRQALESKLADNTDIHGDIEREVKTAIKDLEDKIANFKEGESDIDAISELAIAEKSLEVAKLRTDVKETIDGTFTKKQKAREKFRRENPGYGSFVYAEGGLVDTLNSEISSASLSDLRYKAVNAQIAQTDKKDINVEQTLEEAAKRRTGLSAESKNKLIEKVDDELTENYNSRDATIAAAYDQDREYFESVGIMKDENGVDEEELLMDPKGAMLINTVENAINERAKGLKKLRDTIASFPGFVKTKRGAQAVVDGYIGAAVDAIVSDIDYALEAEEGTNELAGQYLDYLMNMAKFVSDPVEFTPSKSLLTKINKAIEKAQKLNESLIALAQEQDKLQERKQKAFLKSLVDAVAIAIPGFTGTTFADIQEAIDAIKKDPVKLSEVKDAIRKSLGEKSKELKGLVATLPTALSQSSAKIVERKALEVSPIAVLFSIAELAGFTNSAFKVSLDSKDLTPQNETDKAIISVITSAISESKLMELLQSDISLKDLFVALDKNTGKHPALFPEQRNAVNAFAIAYGAGRGMFYLQGVAGAGKTTVALSAFLQTLFTLGAVKPEQVFAMAKGAAVNSKVNKFVNGKEDNTDWFVNSNLDTAKLQAALADKTLLVVDEIGKLLGIEYDQLMTLVEEINKTREAKDKLRVLMTGDPNQIAGYDTIPVIDGSNTHSLISRASETTILPPLTISQRTNNPRLLSFQNRFVLAGTANVFAQPFTESHNADHSQGVAISTSSDEFINRLKAKIAAGADVALIVETKDQVEFYKSKIPGVNVYTVSASQGLDFDEVFVHLLTYSNLGDGFTNHNGFERDNKAHYTAISRAKNYVNLLNASSNGIKELTLGDDVNALALKAAKFNNNTADYKSYLKDELKNFGITKEEAAKTTSKEEEKIDEDLDQQGISDKEPSSEFIDFITPITNNRPEDPEVKTKGTTPTPGATKVNPHYAGVKKVSIGDEVITMRRESLVPGVDEIVYLLKDGDTYIEVGNRQVPRNGTKPAPFSHYYGEAAVNSFREQGIEFGTARVSNAGAMTYSYSTTPSPIDGQTLSRIKETFAKLFSSENYVFEPSSINTHVFVATNSNIAKENEKLESEKLSLRIGVPNSLGTSFKVKSGATYMRVEATGTHAITGETSTRIQYIPLEPKKLTSKSPDLAALLTFKQNVKTLEGLLSGIYPHKYGTLQVIEATIKGKKVPVTSGKLFLDLTKFSVNSDGSLSTYSQIEEVKKAFEAINAAPNRDEIAKAIQDVHNDLYSVTRTDKIKIDNPKLVDENINVFASLTGTGVELLDAAKSLDDQDLTDRAKEAGYVLVSRSSSIDSPIEFRKTFEIVGTNDGKPVVYHVKVSLPVTKLEGGLVFEPNAVPSIEIFEQDFQAYQEWSEAKDDISLKAKAVKRIRKFFFKDRKDYTNRVYSSEKSEMITSGLMGAATFEHSVEGIVMDFLSNGFIQREIGPAQKAFNRIALNNNKVYLDNESGQFYNLQRSHRYTNNNGQLVNSVTGLSLTDTNIHVDGLNNTYVVKNVFDENGQPASKVYVKRNGEFEEGRHGDQFEIMDLLERITTTDANGVSNVNNGFGLRETSFDRQVELINKPDATLTKEQKVAKQEAKDKYESYFESVNETFVEFSDENIEATETKEEAPVETTSNLQNEIADIERRKQEVERLSNKELTSPTGKINTGKIEIPILPSQNIDKTIYKDNKGVEYKVKANFKNLQDVLLGRNGKYLFRGMQGRFFVLAKVGDFYLPFYISSAGTSGKKQGEWYPFFGYTGNWLVKGRVGNKGEMEYSQKISEVQKLLQENLQFPSRFLNLKGEMKVGDNVIYDINQDFNYIEHFTTFGDGTVKREGDKYPILKETLWIQEITGFDPRNVNNDGKGSAYAWINDVIALTENAPLASKGKINAELAALETTPQSNIEAKKADIERRRQEELKKFPTTVRLKKNNVNGENTELTERQIGSVEKAISKSISEGKSAEETIAILNALGFVPLAGNETTALLNYIKDRIEGKEIRPYNEIHGQLLDKINAKYDAELTNLNTHTTSEQKQEQIADIEKKRLEELLGETFAKTTEKIVTSKGQSNGKTIIRKVKSKISSDGEVLTITPTAEFKEGGGIVTTPETMTLKEFKEQFYEKMSEEDKEFFDEIFEGVEDTERIKLKEARIGLKGVYKGQVNIEVETLEGQSFGFRINNGKEINAKYDAILAKLTGKTVNNTTYETELESVKALLASGDSLAATTKLMEMMGKYTSTTQSIELGKLWADLTKSEETTDEDDDIGVKLDIDEGIPADNPLSTDEAMKVAKSLIPDITTDELLAMSGAIRVGSRTISKALGYFERGVIYLLTGDSGTVDEQVVRHEAFHKIFRQYVPTSTRQAVITAVKKTKAFEAYMANKGLRAEDATWVMAEEFLALTFQKYNLGKVKASGFTAKLFNFLKRIMNGIQRLLGRDEAIVEKLFQDITDLKYKTRLVPNAESTSAALRKIDEFFPEESLERSLKTYTEAVALIKSLLTKYKGEQANNEFITYDAATDTYSNFRTEGVETMHLVTADIRNQLNAELVKLGYTPAQILQLWALPNAKLKLELGKIRELSPNTALLLQLKKPDTIKALIVELEGESTEAYLETVSEELRLNESTLTDEGELATEAVSKGGLHDEITSSLHIDNALTLTKQLKREMTLVKTEGGNYLTYRYVYARLLSYLINEINSRGSSVKAEIIKLQSSAKTDPKSAAVLKFLLSIYDKSHATQFEFTKGKTESFLPGFEYANNTFILNGREFYRGSAESAQAFYDIVREEMLKLAKTDAALRGYLAKIGALDHKLRFYNFLKAVEVKGYNADLYRQIVHRMGSQVQNDPVVDVVEVRNREYFDQQQGKHIKVYETYVKTAKISPNGIEVNIKNTLLAGIEDFLVKNKNKDLGVLLNIIFLGNPSDILTAFGLPSFVVSNIREADKNKLAEALKGIQINLPKDGGSIDKFIDNSKDSLDGYLNTISKVLAKSDDFLAALSYIDSRNNNRYIFTTGSWMYDVLNGLLVRNGKQVRLPKVLTSLNHISVNNIFSSKNKTGKIQEIFDVVALDGMVKNYNGIPDEYPSLKYQGFTPADFFQHRFVHGFLASASLSEKTPAYYQYTYIQSDRKSDVAAKIKVLNFKELRLAYEALQSFERDRAELIKNKTFRIANFNKAETKWSGVTWPEFLEQMKKDALEDFELMMDEFVSQNKLFTLQPNNLPALPKVVRTLETLDIVPKDIQRELSARVADGFKKYTTDFTSEEDIKQLFYAFYGFYLQNYLNSEHLNQLVFGDKAFTKHMVDLIKRMQGTQSPGDAQLIDPVIGNRETSKMVVAADFVKNTSLAEDVKKIYEKLYRADINSTDAVTLITPFTISNLHKGTGNYHLQGHVKPVAFGIDSKGVTHYIKTAAFEITNELASAFPELKRIRKEMETHGLTDEQKSRYDILFNKLIAGVTTSEERAEYEKLIQNSIEYYVFESAYKVGRPMDLIQNGESIQDKHVINFDNSLMRIQGDPLSSSTDISNTTQFNYFANTNGLNEAETFMLYKIDAELMRTQFDIYNTASEIMDADGNVSQEKVKAMIKKALAKSAQDERMWDMLHNKVDVNFPSIVKRAVISIANKHSKNSVEIRHSGKKLVAQSALGITLYQMGNTPVTYRELTSTQKSKADRFGTLPYNLQQALIQVADVLSSSDLFIDGSRVSSNAYLEENFIKYLSLKHKLTEEQLDLFNTYSQQLKSGDKDIDILVPRRLQMRDANNYTEVIVPQWWYKSLPKELQEAIKTNSALMLKLTTGMAVRIPTTGIHSSVPLRIIVATDPAINRIIAPEELVALHGSDFDVDSLFVMHREYVTEKDLGGKDSIKIGDFQIKKGYLVGYDSKGELSLPFYNALLDAINSAKDKTTKGMLLNIKAKFLLNSKVDNNLKLITADKNQRDMNTPISFEPFKLDPFASLTYGDYKEWSFKTGGKSIEEFIKDTIEKNKASLPESIISILDEQSFTIKKEDFKAGKLILPKKLKEALLASDIGVEAKMKILLGKQDLKQNRDINKLGDAMRFHQDNHGGKMGVGIQANSMKVIAYLMYGGKFIFNGKSMLMSRVTGMSENADGTFTISYRTSDGNIVEESGTLSRPEVKIRKVIPTVEDGEVLYDYSDLEFLYKPLSAEKTISYNTLSRLTKSKRHHVFELLDTLINGYIDNVKEQVTSVINANSMTIDAISMMIGLGFEFDSAAYVMNQPIIKEITKSKITYNGKITKLLSADTTDPGKLYAKLKELEPGKAAIFKKEMSLKEFNPNFGDAELTNVISKFGDMSLEEMLASPDLTSEDVVAQVSALLFFQELKAITSDFFDVNRVLKLLQSMPVEVEEMRKTKMAIDKIKEGRLSFESDNLLQIPHIAEAVSQFESMYNTVTQTIYLARPEVQEALAKVKENTGFNLKTMDSSANSLDTVQAITDQFQGFLLSSVIEEAKLNGLFDSLKQYVGVDTVTGELVESVENGTKTNYTVTVRRKEEGKWVRVRETRERVQVNIDVKPEEMWMQQLLLKLQSIKQDVNNPLNSNRFFSSFVISRNKNKPGFLTMRYVKSSGTDVAMDAVMRHGFITMDPQLQQEFTVYAILQDRGRFGFDKFTNYIPTSASASPTTIDNVNIINDLYINNILERLFTPKDNQLDEELRKQRVANLMEYFEYELLRTGETMIRSAIKARSRGKQYLDKNQTQELLSSSEITPAMLKEIGYEDTTTEGFEIVKGGNERRWITKRSAQNAKATIYMHVGTITVDKKSYNFYKRVGEQTDSKYFIYNSQWEENRFTDYLKSLDLFTNISKESKEVLMQTGRMEKTATIKSPYEKTSSYNVPLSVEVAGHPVKVYRSLVYSKTGEENIDITRKEGQGKDRIEVTKNVLYNKYSLTTIYTLEPISINSEEAEDNSSETPFCNK